MMLMCIFVGPKTWKGGQQAMMQIDDATAGELPADVGRQNAHVPRQNYVVDFVLINQLFQLSVMDSRAMVLLSPL